MKALTLWQPWASLIVDGRKPDETRPRPWYYVGEFAIHAGQYVDREACVRFGYDPDTIPTGAVLGTAHKTGCIKTPSPYAPPNPYGNFDPNRFVYPVTNVKKFDTPVPAKGSQGVWEWEP